MKFCAKGIKNQLTYLRKEIQFNAGLGSVLVLLNNMFYSKHLMPVVIEMQLLYFILFNFINYFCYEYFTISFYSLFLLRIFIYFFHFLFIYLLFISKCIFNFSIYLLCVCLVSYFVSSFLFKVS
jgi:hypothetical protein